MRGEPSDRLFIPVAESELNEHIEVPLDRLPHDADDILDVLKAEVAPIRLWLDFAKVYLEQGLVDQHLLILKQITGDDVLSHFGDAVKFERVQAYCALAQYHMSLARGEQDTNKRTQLQNEANKYLNAAKNEDPTEQLVHLGYGQLEMLKGNTNAAMLYLVKAQKSKCNGRTNVAGHVALAQLHYQQEDYEKALKLYQEALKMFSDGPNSIRLGIAACQYKLRNIDLAEAAYKRVLQLDPHNSEALAGMAAIQLTLSNSKEAIKGGSKLIFRSLELGPNAAPVLNALATAALIRGDYEEGREFAECALAAADTLPLKGSCYCTLARAHHAAGNFVEAQSCYSKANRFNHKLPLSHFGLAQMLVQQGETKNATAELETVLEMRPNDIDALTLLGHLYSHMPTKAEKTIPRFKEAARKHQDDAAVQETLGEVLATQEPVKSLEAYKRALELHRTRIDKERKERAKGGDAGARSDSDPISGVPIRLLNNAAVLYYRASQTRTALELLQEAMAAVEAGASEAADVPESCIPTLKFNLARLQEACGDSQRAVAAYKAILEQQPHYIECHIRLSYLARKKGDHKMADKYASEAMAMEGGHEDAVLMMAHNRIKAKDYGRAKTHLNKLLKAEGGPALAPNDLFANVLAGNLALLSTPAESSKPGAAPDKARKKEQLQYWTTAMRYYKTALKADPGNIYAANGLGAVCAEMGQLDAAREIFSQLRESTSSAVGGLMQIPDVWVNLGSIHLARDEPEDAARLYRTALEKFNSKDSRVLLWLARALYNQGKLAETKRVLLKAIHIAPTDSQLLFNAAYTLQQSAINLLRKKREKSDPARLAELSTAVNELAQAASFFQRLATLGKRAGIPAHNLKSHFEFCATSLKKAEEHLESAKVEVGQLKAKQEEQARILQVAIEQRNLQQQMREEMARQKALQDEEKAKQAHARARALQEKWRNADAMSTAVKEGDGAAAAKAMKKQRQAQREEEVAMDHDLFGEDSDDEDYDEAALARDQAQAEREEAALKAAGHDSDDERGTMGMEWGGGDDESPRVKHRLKRKAGDDEDDGTLAALGLESGDDDDDQQGGGFEDMPEPAGGGDERSPEKPNKRHRTAILDSDDEA